jgi:elongation factor Ts
VLAEQAASLRQAAERSSPRWSKAACASIYEEVVLLEQVFRHGRREPREGGVERPAKELGAPVKLAGFARFALGEGIEKKSGGLRRRGRAALLKK